MKTPVRFCVPAVFLAALGVVQTAVAQTSPDYRTRVVVSGLERPTGIVAKGSDKLFITQLPTPGVPGSAGGRNTVEAIALSSGRRTVLTLGEPEPTNLALDKHGVLFWTCRSAGVILQRDNSGDVSPLLGGLDAPTGLAIDRWDKVYFTQLPTPGTPGGAGGLNTVNRFDGEQVEVLTLGEPEPTDIAVTRDGDAYWTCRSAGVILRRTADGQVSLLLAGLESPTGIAVDHQGRKLFFTEVPTPGLPGSRGGRNRVSEYNLRTGALDVVDLGDPEPTDIAVARNGHLYWTCSSAGVIVEAAPRRGQP
jgi:hypothetical protein